MNVLALFGPTASGKTAVAAAIADRIPAVVISADSMQAYRGVPVLTAQPPEPTELVAIWELDHEASVAEYLALAHAAVDAALAREVTPVVAGGSGLYLRAALADLDLPPPPAQGARDQWERLYEDEGPEAAHAVLMERDPQAAGRVHPNDRKRVVRALELSEAGASLAPAEDLLWSGRYRHPTQVFGLEVPREELDRRIEERAAAMFEKGVVDEVDRARASRLSRTATQIIGLREITELSPDDACKAIVARTKRLAAYQRKWMRRIPGLASVAADRPPDETADEILTLARCGKRLPAHRGVAER